MRFVVSTWNCFGAAQTAGSFLRWQGPPDAHRFSLPEVVRAVEEVDVMCMQEVFLRDAETFFERLSHSHKMRDSNHTEWWPLTFGGSGLGIASRFEIVSQRVLPFPRPQLGTERFGRKGMLHARLRLSGAPGVEVDVVTTHMQSGYSERAAQIRRRQLAELRALVDQAGAPERAFIVCGDLNIDGLSPTRAVGEYAAITATLPEFEDLGAAEDRPTFHPHPEVNELAHRYEAESPHQRLDYVFFRGPRNRAVRPHACRLVLDRAYEHAERGRTFASDHFALEATFEVARH